VAFAAVSIAMSFALSYIRFFRMPHGGSVTLARFVPLAIYSYIFGVKRGLMAGLIWGTLRLFVDPIIVHPAQFILEYPVSFMMIGIAGFARYIKAPKFLPEKLKWNNRVHPSISLTLGLVAVAAVRYIIHVTSGVIWISAFTGGDMSVSGDGFGAVLTSSLLINSVVFLDTLVSIVAMALLTFSPQIRNLLSQTEEKFLQVRQGGVKSEEAVTEAEEQASEE
jgi:energy-coupled thiamine transporter ThiT